jgi:hypothetical protein
MDTTLRIALRFGPAAPGTAGDPGDPGEIEQICAALREAGADGASHPDLATPESGFRGGDGQLPDVIATATSAAPLLGQLISAVRRWLAIGGNPWRTVEMTIGGNSIKLSGVSREDEERLITAFIEQACAKPERTG